MSTKLSMQPPLLPTLQHVSTHGPLRHRARVGCMSGGHGGCGLYNKLVAFMLMEARPSPLPSTAEYVAHGLGSCLGRGTLLLSQHACKFMKQ